MPKNIYPGTGQPAITGNASYGKPVPSNEFSMDFEVEVTEDGCYVIEFKLWRKVIGPDSVILVNRDGWLQPHCLGAGVRHKFRITTATPPPPGSTPPPPPPAGTTILPPLSGDWPTTYPIDVYYEIKVYYIGPCSGGNCARITRAQLPAQLYLRLEGPNTGQPDYEVKAIRVVTLDVPLLPEGQALASLDQALPPPLAFAGSRPSHYGAMHEVSSESALYQLRHMRNANTLNGDGIEVTRFALGGDAPKLTVRMHVAPTFPSLLELGQALLDIERGLAKEQRPKIVYAARSSIVRHGRMTLYDRPDTLSGYFIDDRFVGASLPRRKAGGWPTPDPFEPFRPTPGGAIRAGEEKTDTIWMYDEWWVWPFAWIVVGWGDYEYNINDVITSILDPVINDGDCLKKLEVLSHGGPLSDPTTGTEVGSQIRMGTDNLRSVDFDANGNVTNPLTKQLLDKLKAALCPGAKLIFSACDQRVGNLLRDVSKYLGNDITVIGNTGTGFPKIEGGQQYKNGVRL